MRDTSRRHTTKPCAKLTASCLSACVGHSNLRQALNYPLSKGEGEQGSGRLCHLSTLTWPAEGTARPPRALPYASIWDKPLPPPPPTVHQSPVPPSRWLPAPWSWALPESWGSDPHFPPRAPSLLSQAKPTGPMNSHLELAGGVPPAQVQG